LQEAVINELKSKAHSVREKKLLQQDEVYNGALEDILLGLKSEPYALRNGSSGTEVDGSLQSSKRFKRPDNVSLLEHTRLRNIGE